MLWQLLCSFPIYLAFIIVHKYFNFLNFFIKIFQICQINTNCIFINLLKFNPSPFWRNRIQLNYINFKKSLQKDYDYDYVS